MIRVPTLQDFPAILQLVRMSGFFSPEDLGEIESRLDAYFRKTAESSWLIYEEGGVEGVIYCIPEPMTNATWNILMLLVSKDSQGKGIGSALIEAAQASFARENARLLIVETSGTDGFEGAKRFYSACGFREVARIPHFYDTNDDKIIFTKSIL